VTEKTPEVLAALLKAPSKRLRDVAAEVCEGLDEREREKVVSESRDFMKRVAKPSKKSDDPLEAPPFLIDRLTFAWTLLRQVDVRIRGFTLPTPPKPANRFQAPPDADSFQREAVVAELSGAFFDGTLPDPIRSTLFDLLSVGDKGEFLVLYRTFLKSSKPRKLGINILRADGTLIEPNAKRLIRWSVRRLNMRYVDVIEGEGVIHFSFAMELVFGQFLEYSGLKRDHPACNKLKELVNDELTEWLQYGCLDGSAIPESRPEHLALIKAFQEANNLKERVHFAATTVDPIKDRRIAELEAELAKAHEEIRSLTAQVSAATAAAQPASAKPVESDQAGEDRTAQAVRDICKAIESKYPLDTLSDAQHSDDPMLSLRSVLGHLFFVLRRQGLTSYPTEDTFDLPYEKVGLYECLDFEVKSGETRSAEVVQRGWAIKTGGQLLPIRRAQVRLSDDSAT
jgi:hypothetical protein